MLSIIKKLWNSPTFTSWGNQATQAFRLLAVTPLILTHFKTEEIAAWYLFGTLMFLGDMIMMRMGLTFSRMIAFGMAGATDLAPITENKKATGSGSPNWPLIARAYGTIGSLNAFLALITTGVAIGMGYYGLKEIASSSGNSAPIWWAFAIFVCSKGTADFFQRYDLALKGMNYVALSNRWNVVFSLLSILSGFIALSLGANIWQLAFTMQFFSILNIMRNRFLLRHVESGRYKQMSSYCIDIQVLKWAWPPFIKGLAVNFSHSASAQFAGVVFARHGSVKEVAAYLFSMRLLDTIQQISMVPYNSNMPLMSRLMAQGDTPRLAKLTHSRVLYSQLIFVAGSATLAILGTPLLTAIGANTNILPKSILALIALGVLAKSYLITTLGVSAIGNHIICFWRMLFSGLASVGLALLLIPGMGLNGLIISVFIPQIILLNTASTRIAASRLECSTGSHLWNSTGPAVGMQCIILGICIFLGKH